MDYESLQDKIVARLQPFVVAGLDVVRLPENDAEFSLVKPRKAKFTVIYAGSEYGKTLSTAEISQDEEIFFQILIESSFLYGPLGVYALVSLLKKALTGYKPEGCKRIQVSKHHTIGNPEATRSNNMWQYNAVFSTSTVHVQESEEEVTALLKKITFIDVPDGEINVVPEIEEN